MERPYVSVVIPTYRHAWELDQVMYSILVKGKGVSFHEYEVIIINDDPDDVATKSVAERYNRRGGNVRYVEVYDSKQSGITNATRAGNIGARTYARGDLLIMVVDSARIVTPLAVRKTRDEFEKFGPNITTTMHPYHIGRHYTDQSWTKEQCRALMEEIKWKRDPYRLMRVRADTYISKTGNIVESTFQGIMKDHFLSINGWNEGFASWGPYNLDLWRRCTRPEPAGGVQKVGVPGQWGKIGLGLRPINIDGEATFHIKHDTTVGRDAGNLKSDIAKMWKYYETVGECIVVNTDKPSWGMGDSREVEL